MIKTNLKHQKKTSLNTYLAEINPQYLNWGIIGFTFLLALFLTYRTHLAKEKCASKGGQYVRDVCLAPGSIMELD